MKAYQKDKPIISIHIPKCGGTSFINIVQEWFSSKLYLHYYNEKAGKMPEKVKLKKGIFNSYINNLCIHGHFNKNRDFGITKLYPDVDQFFTFLRDPLEMSISVFFYRHKLLDNNNYYNNGIKINSFPMDIDQYLEESNPYMLNQFPDGINEENYKEFINEKFVHIGVIENYQNSINLLAEKLNKKPLKIEHLNESRRTQTPSESAIKKFIERCSLENKIYQYAIELNK